MGRVYNSVMTEIGPVTEFPEFTGERVYMAPFRIKDGLPPELRRWQATVDQMLHGVTSDMPVYVMIDQGFVPAGISQRRGGIHIDGYWCGATHGSVPPRHYPTPSPTPQPKAPVSTPEQEDKERSKKPTRKKLGNMWDAMPFDFPEALIVASNVIGARGYIGEFTGPIHDGGNCIDADLSKVQPITLAPYTAYAGNVTWLHESIPVEQDCYRTMVRLNVPGWSPELYA